MPKTGFAWLWLWLLPLVIMKKDGTNMNVLGTIAGAVLGAAIVGIVVGYISTTIITSNLGIKFDNLKERLIKIEEQHTDFDGRIDDLEKQR